MGNIYKIHPGREVLWDSEKLGEFQGRRNRVTETKKFEQGQAVWAAES